MSIKSTIGDEKYESIRRSLQGYFPGNGAIVTDETVDAVVRAMWTSNESPQAFGLPEAPEGELLQQPVTFAEPDPYPLYIGNATHHRVRRMKSTQAFESEFVGHLPLVRVPLPKSLRGQNMAIETAIGTVYLSSDHLVGSIDYIAQKYADARHLGYVPERVDLITPARAAGARFGAIALYLGYRKAFDSKPSFYLLEAGTATGTAEMLYFGKTTSSVIIAQSGYVPTPFSFEDDVYRGTLTLQGDEPLRLVIEANAPNMPFYIRVTVDYQKVTAAPSTLPAMLIVEAAERVATIGRAMDVPTGEPLEAFLAALGSALPWTVVPGTRR